jgi:hypothetical protein
MFNIKVNPLDALADARSIMLRQRLSMMLISRTHQGYRAVKPEQKHFGTVVGIVYRDISTT